MSEFHILQPSDRSRAVFGGIFGATEPNPDNENIVRFKIDPALKRCSAIFVSLPPDGMELKKSDVITLDVPDFMVDALKATLARGLQNNWDKQYESLMPGRRAIYQEADDDVGDGRGATLVAIPGMGSVSQGVLEQVLRAEQNVARQAVDALVESLPGVKPFFVNLALNDVWVYTDYSNEDGDTLTRENGGYFSISNNPITCIPIDAWGEFDLPTWEASNKAENTTRLESNSIDMDVAIPIYLPALPEPDLLGENNDPELRQQQAKLMLQTILDTPLLERLIIKNAPYMALDFDSAVIRDDEGDDEDDRGDEDEDGLEREDDPGGSIQAGEEDEDGLEAELQEVAPRARESLGM